MTGLYGKYKIEKVNGEPLDENAKYFVLRYDKDEAAQVALLEYARNCNDKELYKDIIRELVKIDMTTLALLFVDEMLTLSSTSLDDIIKKVIRKEIACTG